MIRSDDNGDMGIIVLTVVIVTLITGAGLYAFNRYETIRTALNIPAIERTVPSIVPQQPQI
jgi:hypothetical protein